MREPPSLPEREALFAEAFGSGRPAAFALAAESARLARLVADEPLPARHAWLVIDGEIVDARGAVIAARGDLVGWRPLLSERIPPVVARARSKAAVLALEREGVLEALLLDFDLVVELARSLALAATPRLEPGPALLAPSVVDRARELRAIEPFDRLPLDAVLEVAAQLSGDPPQAALVRAFAGAEGAASDENVLLDALEDHPRSAIEVLAWLAERAEEATRSCRASA